MQSAQKILVIGDVHGCLLTLEELLDQVQEEMPLLFLGDVINRGPQSLSTLRLIKALGSRAKFLLGNHEMHLLASAAGAGKINRRDTIDEILNAPDSEELIDYIRHQPLLFQWQDYTFVHASIDPAWTLEEAKSLAQEVQTHLQGNDWKAYLQHMYGKDLWDKKLTGDARMRAILNGFTRIRFVDKKGIPDYKIKEGLAQKPDHLMPWFECPVRKTKNDSIVFGHWSTLGLVVQDNVIALDTGCVWGGALTAIELPARKILSVKAPQYLDPLA